MLSSQGLFTDKGYLNPLYFPYLITIAGISLVALVFYGPLNMIYGFFDLLGYILAFQLDCVFGTVDIIRYVFALIFDTAFILLNLVTEILSLVFTLLDHVVFPLLTIITNLLSVIAGLLLAIATLAIAAVGLIIAGVFTCPTEDSFDSWLKSFLKMMMTEQAPPKQNQSNCENPDSDYGFLNSLWKTINEFIQKYFFTSVAPTIMANTIFNKRQFWMCGACRLAICTTPDNKQITFVGALNTWFPFNEKQL